MKKGILCGVFALCLLVSSGCASNRIVGHRMTRESDWYGNLGITGHLNNVTVKSGSQLVKLSIIGDGNKVNIEDRCTLGKIEVWGENNIITIPAGLIVRDFLAGNGNEIVRRPESDLEPEPAPAGEVYEPLPAEPGGAGSRNPSDAGGPNPTGP